MLIFISAEEPEIIGEAAICMDSKTKEIIYARNMEKIMYPASITKLMTALLLAQNREPEDILTYTTAAKAVYPYKLDLAVGEEIYAAEAMDAILLFSANDIAYLVAENIGGTFEAFADMMNQKALYLGQKNTHFVTPNGLHDEQHYTTAYDISLLLREMYKYPWIMESTGKSDAHLTTLQNSSFDIKNRNKLVNINGCVGGKTGWTPEAGRCLAALYERGGRPLAAVILNSEYDREDTVVFRDMENLISYSYHLQRTTLYKQGEPVTSVQSTYKLLPLLGPEREITVELVAGENIMEYTADPYLSQTLQTIEIHPWELKPDLAAGELLIAGKEILHRYMLYPVISASDLLKKHIWFYLFTGSSLLLIILVTILLLSRKKR